MFIKVVDSNLIRPRHLENRYTSRRISLSQWIIFWLLPNKSGTALYKYTIQVLVLFHKSPPCLLRRICEGSLHFYRLRYNNGAVFPSESKTEVKRLILLLLGQFADDGQKWLTASVEVIGSVAFEIELWNFMSVDCWSSFKWSACAAVRCFENVSFLNSSEKKKDKRNEGCWSSSILNPAAYCEGKSQQT